MSNCLKVNSVLIQHQTSSIPANKTTDDPKKRKVDSIRKTTLEKGASNTLDKPEKSLKKRRIKEVRSTPSTQPKRYDCVTDLPPEILTIVFRKQSTGIKGDSNFRLVNTCFKNVADLDWCNHPASASGILYHRLHEQVTKYCDEEHQLVSLQDITKSVQNLMVVEEKLLRNWLSKDPKIQGSKSLEECEMFFYHSRLIAAELEKRGLGVTIFGNDLTLTFLNKSNVYKQSDLLSAFLVTLTRYVGGAHRIHQQMKKQIESDAASILKHENNLEIGRYGASDSGGFGSECGLNGQFTFIARIMMQTLSHANNKLLDDERTICPVIDCKGGVVGNYSHWFQNFIADFSHWTLRNALIHDYIGMSPQQWKGAILDGVYIDRSTSTNLSQFSHISSRSVCLHSISSCNDFSINDLFKQTYLFEKLICADNMTTEKCRKIDRFNELLNFLQDVEVDFIPWNLKEHIITLYKKALIRVEREQKVQETTGQ